MVATVRSSGGFTLVEMLVAVGSSALILAAAGSFSRAQGRALERESRHLRLRETVRRVLGTMSREVRGAGFAPVIGGFDGAADGLSIASTDRFEVRADLHGAATGDPPDGVLDVDSDERIGFSLNGARGVVTQTIGRQSQPLTLDGAVPARGLVVRYFDACDDEITVAPGAALDEDARRRVRRMTIRLAAHESGGETLTAETGATLRNRHALRCE
jgi:type II secretory pathway pseudopilin PulG